LPEVEPAGTLSITGPSTVGTFTLAPSTASSSADRQVEPDIVAVAREEAVRVIVDGDDRVAIAARPRLALAGEADLGAFLDALGKLDLDRLAVAAA
jgi:hypothetical protein